jgi:hypothetical protein
LLAFDDGDADLFLTARNLVEQSKFAERLCVQGEIPGERREFSINTRRRRIAAMDRVIRTGDGRVEVGGYREWLAGGYFRDWPPQQIIEIRRLNPFKPDEPYSMSAGTYSQFTLKQAGEFFWRTMLMAQRPTRPLNLASMAPLMPSTSAAPRREATWCSRRLHQQGSKVSGKGSTSRKPSVPLTLKRSVPGLPPTASRSPAAAGCLPRYWSSIGAPATEAR